MGAWFDTITSSLASGLAIISVLITAWKFLFDRVSEAQTKRETRESVFKKVLESDNLAALGAYLDNTIGKVNVREYVTSQAVSSQVDAFILKLSHYVNDEPEIVAQKPETEPLQLETQTRPSTVSLELASISDKIHSGEIWNGLAQLRRFIEITLRKLIEKSKIKEPPKPMSARTMLRYLIQHGIIPKEVDASLTFVISVCNRAIHGRDVTLGEAEEVVQIAANTLYYLEPFGDFDENQEV